MKDLSGHAAVNRQYKNTISSRRNGSRKADPEMPLKRFVLRRFAGYHVCEPEDLAVISVDRLRSSASAGSGESTESRLYIQDYPVNFYLEEKI